MKCESCKFYVEFAKEGFFTSAEGKCKRYPPATLIWNNEPRSIFPNVLPKEWCGEYQENSSS